MYWEDVREQLQYITGHYKVLEIHTKKYVLPGNSKAGIITADLPEEPIKGCRAHVSLLSHVLISKFADHLPLYRIEEQFKRTGLHIPRQTLSSWVLKLGMFCRLSKYFKRSNSYSRQNIHR